MSPVAFEVLEEFEDHAHTGSDGSLTVTHANTTGKTANDHHAQLHQAAHAAAGADPITSLGAISFTGALSIGATPATAGAVRLTNNTYVGFRNGANTGNVVGLYLDNVDNLYLGGAGGAAVASLLIGAPAVLVGTLTVGGITTAALQVCTSGPLIYSGSGAPTISATVKGSLYLRSDGTTTNNRAYIATDTVGGWTALTTAA